MGVSNVTERKAVVDVSTHTHYARLPIALLVGLALLTPLAVAQDLEGPGDPITLAEEAAEANPNDPNAILMLAQAYLGAERFEDAQAAIERYGGMEGADPSMAVVNEAKILAAQGRVQAALDLLNEAMEDAQDAYTGYYLLSHIAYYHYVRDDMEAASEAYRQLVDLAWADDEIAEIALSLSRMVPEEERAVWHAVAGIIHYEDEALAVAALRPVADAHPDQYVLWRILSNLYFRAGQPEQAIAAADKAIQLRPELPRNYLHRARGLKAADREDEAIAAYEAAIERAGWDTFTARFSHQRLAEIHEGAGRFDQALEHQLASMHGPDTWDDVGLLEIVEKTSLHGDTADYLVENPEVLAYNADPTAEPYMLVPWLYGRAGRYEEMRTHMDRILEEWDPPETGSKWEEFVRASFDEMRLASDEALAYYLSSFVSNDLLWKIDRGVKDLRTVLEIEPEAHAPHFWIAMREPWGSEAEYVQRMRALVDATTEEHYARPYMAELLEQAEERMNNPQGDAENQ